MNIRIRKAGKKIYFETYIEKIEKDRLNVTNIWNFKEIIFEEKKLKEPFIINFLKELFEKEKIEEVHLEKINMIVTVFPLIQNVSCIEKIVLEENETVPSSLYSEFKKLNFIKMIECYQMTSFLFNECVKNLKIEISYRKKTFIKSNFMITNDLTTHSKIYYKKRIVMYDTYTKDDLLDFEFFLKENKNLQTIDCYSHSKTFLKQILIQLLTNQKTKIEIRIFQKDEEQKEMEELLSFLKKTFKEELKNYHITFQFCYTKKYKERNLLKQVNLNIFRVFLIILLIFSTSIYIISKIHLYHNQKTKDKIENIIESKEETKQEDDNEENKQEIIEEPKKEEQEKEDEEKEDEEKDEPKAITYQKNFSELKKINSEFVTWLTVPNTSISYPVVKHKDNDYYLTHSFDKSYNIGGWIFMDYRNHSDFSDQNTIIYGHDSYSTTMFGTLKNILKKDWYTKNKTITLEANGKKIEAEIFSIYTIPNTNDYLQVVFSEKEFGEFIDKIINRSIYNFQIKPTTDDHIVTLSTCYKDSKNRLVLHAKIK